MNIGDRVFVVPAKGLSVRNPQRDMVYLPAEGDFVVWGPYWHRRAEHLEVFVRLAPVTESEPAVVPVEPEVVGTPAPAKKKGN